MRQYFTTPIYYVNGDPHIGHCYTGILTDVLTRISAMNGFEVRMQTGTDEHGNKVEQAAKLAGVENTIDFCTEVSNKFKNLMLATNLCCTYNKFDAADNFYITKNKDFAKEKNFIRTTDEKHKKSVQELWHKLDENGWIYKSSYKGWYAIRDEAFYDESEIIDGKAPSGAPVEWKEEEAYFFKLSAFQDILVNFYQDEGRGHLPDFIRPEMISFMKGGLRDLCISRVGLNWGIRVPNDEKHAVYVWLDALQNYISALGDQKEKWWDNVDCKTHVIGKDIVRFHAIYWPAFLLGREYTIDQILNLKLYYDFENPSIVKYKNENLKKEITLDPSVFSRLIYESKLIPNFIVHGWWLNNGEKMSKSLNNSLDPYAEIEFIKQQIDQKIARPQDLDALALDYFRYFLIKAMPSGNDGNYSRERMIEVVNSDLVNNIGNLANRVFNLVYKNKFSFEGSPPLPKKSIIDYLINIDNPLSSGFGEDLLEVFYTGDKFSYHAYISNAIIASSKINFIIDQEKPWNLIKENKKEDFDAIMFMSLIFICKIALSIRPIVPFIAESILDYIKIPQGDRNFLSKSYQEIVIKNINAAFKEPPYPIVPRLLYIR